MGGHKSISGTSHEPIIPPPTPDYIVSGDITPDAKGNYFFYQIYEVKNSYRRTDNLWWIWWSQSSEVWVIATWPPNGGPAYWTRESEEIVGEYIPRGTATGTAIVTAGS